MVPRSTLIRLSLVALPVLVLGACSKAGSNNEDDLNVPPVATFTIGGTLTGLDSAEAIELRLEHNFSELFLDEDGLSRPTARSEILALDATRNDRFYAFDAELPAGTQYRVRVVAQPQTQGCEVDNRDGVLPEDDIVDVDIRCDEVVLAQPRLNDSGIDWCADDLRRHQTGTPLEKEEGFEVLLPGVIDPRLVPGCQQIAATHPGQDGLVGRDAVARADAINATNELGKQGAGEAGFDFIKVSNGGDPLPAAAPLGAGAGDWACTLDAVTGLLWEVKVDDPTHLRHLGWSYSWFSSSLVNTGGTPGAADRGVCLDDDRCDIERFVEDVNAEGLCGFNDWRLPMREELRSIMHYGRPAPAIDPEYFPDLAALAANTFLATFWTRSPYAGDFDVAGEVGVPNAAWTILADGGGGFAYKGLGLRVRLVRGDPVGGN